MLKRQRPSTPPPAFTFDELQPDHAILVHQAKRRRVEPSISTGPSSGDWNQQRQQSIEDEVDCDDEPATDCHPQTQHVTNQVLREYRSTNEMLHELHTLNQHRLAFAPDHSNAHMLRHPSNNAVESHKGIMPEPVTSSSSRPYKHEDIQPPEQDTVHQNYQQANK